MSACPRGLVRLGRLHGFCAAAGRGRVLATMAQAIPATRLCHQHHGAAAGAPGADTVALTLFACRAVGAHSYLEADFAWRCDDPAVVAPRWALGFPMLLAYTVGIPLSYLLVLRRNRDRIYGDLHATYGFLVAGFRPNRYYWELWNSIRKASFTAGLWAPSGSRCRPGARWGSVPLLCGLSKGTPTTTRSEQHGDDRALVDVCRCSAASGCS